MGSKVTTNYRPPVLFQRGIHIQSFFKASHESYETHTIIHILQLRKRKLREVKSALPQVTEQTRGETGVPVIYTTEGPVICQ